MWGAWGVAHPCISMLVRLDRMTWAGRGRDQGGAVKSGL